MSWQPVPLAGPSAHARAIGQNPERTINLYPETTAGTSQVPVALLGTPGFALFLSLATVVRGWHVMQGRLFSVVGPSILEIRSDATTKNWASLTTVSGFVGISDNNGVLVFGDGTGFYTLDLTAAALTEVKVEGLDSIPGYFSAFIDQVTIYLQRDSRKLWYSDPVAPGTVQGLSFFTAEALGGNANSLIVDRQQIYVGATDRIQPYYDTGDADTPYQPIGSGLIKKGVSAPLTFIPYDVGIVFVGADADAGGYAVWQLSGPGAEPQRISTHAVERDLNDLTDITSLTAMAYGDEGHLFYGLHLTNSSWYWDVGTPNWHERAYLNRATGKFERQRANFHAFAFGKHLVSDWETGDVFEQKLGFYSENGEPLVARREFAVDTEGMRARFDGLELTMKVGVGLDGTGQGTDPQVMMQYSDDGGRSWSDEIWEPLGQIGETETRVLFPRLGTTPQGSTRVYRVSVSDPVERHFLRARSNHTVLG